MRFRTITVFLLALLLVAVLYDNATSEDWRVASRESAHIAPLPAQHADAIVQVYAARAIQWRGWFAVHTWIATKEKNAGHYIVYHVAPWQIARTGKSVIIKEDIPDRYWAGAKPYIIDTLTGVAAETAIPKIRQVAQTYPNAATYRVWPGPNSNTFIAHIIRNVPELGVELPANAIGKDWLNDGTFFSRSESGTGYQLSFLGMLGLTIGKAEGIEINILGLSFGVDVLHPALKLPIIGRLGMKDKL